MSFSGLSAEFEEREPYEVHGGKGESTTHTLRLEILGGAGVLGLCDAHQQTCGIIRDASEERV